MFALLRAPLALALAMCLFDPAFAGPGPADLRADADRYDAPTELATEAGGYRFTRPALLALADAVEHKPGVVTLESIGTSLRGKPIWAFTVAEPGVPVEREVLVFAGIHALEWISTETALDLLHELIAVPPRGVSVTVVPWLNPDGRARVELDLNRGENTYRRGNHAFADLNRDFAHQREARAFWRHILPGYYATTHETPLSQPESRALARLAERGFDRAASLHAFGGYLYHPWAGHWRRTDDHRRFVALGRQMEAAQGDHAYRTRQLSRWGFFFRAHGTELDHLYGEHGTLAWLIELTRSGADLRRPLHSLKTYFRWYNPTNPERHAARGVAALRVLIRAEDAQ